MDQVMHDTFKRVLTKGNAKLEIMPLGKGFQVEVRRMDEGEELLGAEEDADDKAGLEETVYRALSDAEEKLFPRTRPDPTKPTLVEDQPQ